MKEYDNAIEYYKKAIAADPEYAEAYSNVGLVYLMKAQDYADKATTDINDPKYAEAYRLMGVAQLQLKQNKEACASFAKAKELGDPNVDALIEKHCK